MKTEFRRTL